MDIFELDAQNYWSIRADAATGEILDKYNYVVHDNWHADGKAPQHYLRGMIHLRRQPLTNTTSMPCR